jgi:hypothetical protein
MLLTRNTENGSNGHMIGLKLSNTDLERDWSMRVGWPFQVNQTVMQIQNVIAIINGAEDFWNSFLTQRGNLCYKMFSLEAWVFSHLQWETIADMPKSSCFPWADILYMHVGQIHYIRKSPWRLNFWCCGSQQWKNITSRGLASQGYLMCHCGYLIWEICADE